MDNVTAVLVAAAIGAVGGLAAGGFGAVASVRASQLAARAPLAERIHRLGSAIVKLRTAIGSPDYSARLIEFNRAWNNVAVHQKLLAPSYRVAALSDLVLRTVLQAQTNPNAAVDLAAQSISVMIDMIGAHSRYLLRWNALEAERRILEHWLTTQKSQVMSPELRQNITQLAAGTDLQPYD